MGIQTARKLRLRGRFFLLGRAGFELHRIPQTGRLGRVPLGCHQLIRGLNPALVNALGLRYDFLPIRPAMQPKEKKRHNGHHPKSGKNKQPHLPLLRPPIPPLVKMMAPRKPLFKFWPFWHISKDERFASSLTCQIPLHPSLQRFLQAPLKPKLQLKRILFLKLAVLSPRLKVRTTGLWRNWQTRQT